MEVCNPVSAHLMKRSNPKHKIIRKENLENSRKYMKLISHIKSRNI